MDPSILQQLETAAAIIMASPDEVKLQQRREAEAVLINFRNTGLDGLKMSQFILENSKVDLLLSEAVNVLKHVVIFKWTLMEDELRNGLRGYLLDFVITHPTAPFFLREKLLQVIAIMIKRNSTVDAGVEQRAILVKVKDMLQSQDPAQRMLAGTLIHTLLQEYSDIVKSQDTGLTFDDHFKAKKQFEHTELRNVFVMVLDTMVCIGQAVDDPANAGLLQRLIEAMEVIMTWGYISPIMPKRLINLCESVAKANQAPPLRLCSQWTAIMMNPKVLETFFFLYWKVRENDVVRQKALTCLIQMATLSGPSIQGSKNRVGYLKNYLQHYLQLIGTEVSAEELVGFSMIMRKLMLFHHSGVDLNEDSPELFKAFLTKLFYVTIKCIESSNTTDEESQLYMEGFENSLEAWITLVQTKDHIRGDDIMSPFLVEIFNKYVQVHLSPPEGLRPPAPEEELTEQEEKDRERYREQLLIIGSFAREVLPHSLPILAKLLEDKIRTYAVMLQTLYQSNGQCETNAKALGSIFEDLHWLLLITCNTMGMEADGETSLIPSEINELCQKKITDGLVDVNKSMELIAKPDKDIAETFTDPQNADYILRILGSLMRLSELETTAVNCGMGQYLSPELCGTLMWFFRIWLDSYLFPQADFYTSLCDSARIALTQDSECGKFILNYILRKICFNIQHFASEESVIEDTVEVFLAILKRKHRIQPTYKSEVFAELFNLKDMNLHVNAKRGLLKGLVSIGSSIEDENSLDQIFAPIAARYMTLMHRPDIKQVYQNEDIKLALIVLMEEVKGCIGGVYLKSSSKLFEHFRVMFMELPELLNLYKNCTDIVELLLELFCDTLISLDYTSTMMDKSIQSGIYECCMALIRVWFANNATKISNECKNYEDCPQDILIIFKLLHCLLSKTLFEEEGENNSIDSSDVVVFGLVNLMPLITMDLIRFPDFCSQYYKTIALFASIKTHKLTQLSSDLFQQMLSSIELGLNTFTSEIQSMCFEFISCVASTIYFERDSTTTHYTQLQSFLPLLFNMVLRRQIDQENRIECYGALFMLACTYKEDFNTLMTRLVQNESNPIHAQKIQIEYNDFMQAMEMVNTRAMKTKFVDKFDRFVTNLIFLSG